MLDCGMLEAGDQRRRWFGTLSLIIALGMLFWGETVLKPYLTGRGFVCFWLGCFLATFFALLFALLDFRAIRRKSMNQRRQLVEQTLKNLPCEETGADGMMCSRTAGDASAEDRRGIN